MKKKLLIVALGAALGGGAYWGWRTLTQPKILFLGFADPLVILAEKASARSGIAIASWPREKVDEAKKPFDLRSFRAVLVSGLRAEPYSQAALESFRAAQNAGVKVIVLPPRQAEILRIGNADFAGQDALVAGYFDQGGVENWARLLRFLSITYAGAKGSIEPPAPMPEDGYYHPDADEIFATTGAYRDWYARTGREKAGAPWVAVDFAQGWKSGITQGTDGLVRAFERGGFNVAAMFGATGLGRLLAELKPDVIVNRSHGRFFQGERGVALLRETVDAPVFRGLTLMFEGKTIDEYRRDRSGVRGPGLAIGTVVSELDGTIEPALIEGMVTDSAGRKIEAPIEERMERLVERARRWVDLRRLPNADKRIAVVYFNGIGKADFTAQGLNVPRSLVRLLEQMRAAGYRVQGAPRDAERLLELMLARGRNVSEFEAGEMERLVSQPGVVLAPAEDYGRWFATLPEPLRRAVVEAHGQPPGAFMAVRREGKDYLVIPVLDFGNVILLPQPARAAAMDSKLAHSDKVPPPHQYLAVYWWLHEVWKAHALLHYGTHGTYEFLPGRPVGQLDDDWPDRIVGRLPSIYVYTIDNVGEALIAKRRGSAVIVSHQTPPIQAAELSASDRELAELYRETQRFREQEDGALKERMRARIRELARRRQLDRDLGLDWEKTSPGDEAIRRLEEYLDELEENKIPVGLHVHGVADDPQELRLTITEILGRDFLARHGNDRVRAAAAVGRMLASAPPAAAQPAWFARPMAPTPGSGQRQYPLETQPAPPAPVASGHPAWIPKIGSPPPEVQARLARERAQSPVALAFEGGAAAEAAPGAPAEVSDAARVAALKAAFAESAKEISQTLRALEGRYIAPAAGGDPVRTPSALPTGRNLYGVNPAEIPTQAAWDVGVALADQMIAAERKRLGRYPQKIGFNLWPTELVRQYGSDVAQALWLLGVKPVWDARGLVVDLEVVPARDLGRPRIDIVVQAAGQFRDSFPDRMELLDKAVRLAALAKDGENYVAENSAALEQRLKESGLSAREARQLANARIFSNAPGSYGTGLTGGITNSGAYSDTKALTAEYLDRAGAVFTQGAEWGAKVARLYEKALAGTDAVSISQSSNTISALTLDHYFEYAGGMVMAIRDSGGGNAAAYLADTRNASSAKVKTVEEALAADLRTQLWNRKWIAGMQENDFSGASEIATLASNLYGWQVTKPDAVQPYMWEQTFRLYVEDQLGMGLRDWFDKKNPYAFQNLTATMLEAVRQGYWRPDAAVIERLAREYARSVAAHGTSGGERTAGNRALEEFVRQRLMAPGNQESAQLAEQFRTAVERALTGTQSAAILSGQRLVRELTSPQSPTLARNTLLGGLLLAALLLAFSYGLRRRTR